MSPPALSGRSRRRTQDDLQSKADTPQTSNDHDHLVSLFGCRIPGSSRYFAATLAYVRTKKGGVLNWIIVKSTTAQSTFTTTIRHPPSMHSPPLPPWQPPTPSSSPPSSHHWPKFPMLLGVARRTSSPYPCLSSPTSSWHPHHL